jgi:predicted PurR-regulated permease PerM
LQQRWLAAGFLLVWGVMISMIDNFVTPVLISNRARLDTLTVFIGVLGGASAFGAIGVVLGPLVLALAIALAHFIIEMHEGTPSNVAVPDAEAPRPDRKANR